MTCIYSSKNTELIPNVVHLARTAASHAILGPVSVLHSLLDQLSTNTTYQFYFVEEEIKTPPRKQTSYELSNKKRHDVNRWYQPNGEELSHRSKPRQIIEKERDNESKVKGKVTGWSRDVGHNNIDTDVDVYKMKNNLIKFHSDYEHCTLFP